jgi:hypothetical protein
MSVDASVRGTNTESGRTFSILRIARLLGHRDERLHGPASQHIFQWKFGKDRRQAFLLKKKLSGATSHR